MAWLVYQWERERYPEFRSVQLCNEEAVKILRKLSRHFKLDAPRVKVGSLRSFNGRYFAPSYLSRAEIQLNGREISLGTVIHEFAHHLNHCQYNGKHHGKTFKRALKRCYSWSKRYLPKPTLNSGGI